MKRIIVVLIGCLFVVLIGCSRGAESEAVSMKINDKIFPLDNKLIDSIDKTQWIDTADPPTVKRPVPQRPPQYKIEMPNKMTENFSLWDHGEYYLILINKGEKSFWLAMEGEEYQKAKKQTAKYKDVEIPYLFSIGTFADKLSPKYNSSSIQLIEGVFNIPGFKQEKHCYLEGKECLYIYQGKSYEDASVITEKLEEKLALVDLKAEPRLYSVGNLALMYIPGKLGDYVLDSAIWEAVAQLE